MNLQQKASHEAGIVGNALDRVSLPGTGGIGLASLARQVYQEQAEDRVGSWAASLAYHTLFAIFPFFVLVLSLLAVFHATNLVDSLLAKSGSVLPSDAEHLLRSQILSIARSRAAAGFTLGAIVALVAALWGLTSGFRAVMSATNSMYGVHDRRPFWKTYLVAMTLAVGSVTLLLAALILTVFGPAIGMAVANLIGAGPAFSLAWNIVQWPILLLFVFLAFAVIEDYSTVADVPFRLISPGSVFSVLGWVVFSLLFSLYVSHFGSYNAAYGSFAGLAIFLLYVYYSAYIILLGAEINQVIMEQIGNRQKQSRPQSIRQKQQRKAG